MLDHLHFFLWSKIPANQIRRPISKLLMESDTLLTSLKIGEDLEFDLLNPTKGKAMLIIGESLSQSESKKEMKKQYIRFIPRADIKLVWVRL